MALEHILSALEEAVAAEMAQIQTEADADVHRIHTQADADAEALRLEILAGAELQVQAERTRRIGQAHLTAQRVVLEAKRDAIDAVFAMARRRLMDVRSRGDYAEILAALTEEAIAEIGIPFHLEVDARDGEIIDRLLKGRDEGITVDRNLTTWGGVVAHRPDRRISLDNTLETRIAQVEDLMWGEVGDRLIGEDDDG